MGTIVLTPPPTNTTSWDAARARVQAQLRAYRITDADVCGRLVAEIIEEARRLHEIDAERPPIEIAAELTHRRISAWIDDLIGPTDESPTLRFARGRTAVLLASLPEDWPDLMLDASRVPDELRERVRTTYLEAGPDLTFSKMAPRPIDLGRISTMADGTWRTFARWPVLRGLLMSALFFSMLGTAFYLARF